MTDSIATVCLPQGISQLATTNNEPPGNIHQQRLKIKGQYQKYIEVPFPETYDEGVGLAA